MKGNFMKRIFIIILSMIITFSMVGCSSSNVDKVPVVVKETKQYENFDPVLITNVFLLSDIYKIF